jgi:hypothetical protein
MPKTILPVSRIESSICFARWKLSPRRKDWATGGCGTAAMESLPLDFRFATFTFDLFSCQGKHLAVKISPARHLTGAGGVHHEKSNA